MVVNDWNSRFNDSPRSIVRAMGDTGRRLGER